MFYSAEKFQQALVRTLILLSGALSIAFVWAYSWMPQGNLLIVVFSFLSAVKISEYPLREKQLQVLAAITAGAVTMQFTVSAVNHCQLLDLFLPPLAGYMLLRTLPPGTAYLILLTGFLAYPAPAGAWAALERSIDILIAAVVVMAVTLLWSGKLPKPALPDAEAPLPRRQALLESLIIFCALVLCKLLAMPQGIWIVLTVIFIYMIRQPGESNQSLIRQRIFSVPLGIMLGGIYSGSAVIMDYRLAYLMPLIGAAGFFMLYYRHNFFSFSLFFMFAFTIYADWMSGTFSTFNFAQLLIARTLATAIGAAILLFLEKLASISSDSGKAAI